jgi:hypothetical protein
MNHSANSWEQSEGGKVSTGNDKNPAPADSKD